MVRCRYTNEVAASSRDLGICGAMSVFTFGSFADELCSVKITKMWLFSMTRQKRLFFFFCFLFLPSFSFLVWVLVCLCFFSVKRLTVFTEKRQK